MKPQRRKNIITINPKTKPEVFQSYVIYEMVLTEDEREEQSLTDWALVSLFV